MAILAIHGMSSETRDHLMVITVPKHFHGNLMAISLQFHCNLMEILLESYGSIMKSYGNSIALIVSLNPKMDRGSTGSGLTTAKAG